MANECGRRAQSGAAAAVAGQYHNILRNANRKRHHITICIIRSFLAVTMYQLVFLSIINSLLQVQRFVCRDEHQNKMAKPNRRHTAETNRR